MSDASTHNPLEQFAIKQIMPLELFGYDISITNASATMLLVTFSILVLFSRVKNNVTGVPSKMHIFCENAYNFVSKIVLENTGSDGKTFIPLVFSLLLFIIFSNLFGLIPYGFTVTSHLIVTLILALIVFFTIIISGFKFRGMKFLEIFVPSGMPSWLRPLMAIIELFAFLARPVSLSLRLAANMVAGHVLLKVIAGFIVIMPIYGKIFPFALVIVLIGFEFFVAILQAYIFAVLSSVYLSDSVQGH
ncbi:MAG: F0F1 ATP synthase subunit A [Rickettsiaceae bacterium]|nr:F0F1 ATP synthase subunit A [Rickettsiaceae bacterium]